MCRGIFSGAPFHEVMEPFLHLQAALHECAPDAFQLWLAICPSPAFDQNTLKRLHAVNFAIRRMCADSYQGVFLDTKKIFYLNGRVEQEAFFTLNDHPEEFSSVTNIILKDSISRALSYSMILQSRVSRANGVRAPRSF